jgi:hypothetical protein
MSRETVAAAERPLLVTCSHYMQFAEFCKQNGLNLRDRREVRYIARADDLLGVASGTFVDVSPYLGGGARSEVYREMDYIRKLTDIQTVYYRT